MFQELRVVDHATQWRSAKGRYRGAQKAASLDEDAMGEQQ
jgi:hypothetical protein